MESAFKSSFVSEMQGFFGIGKEIRKSFMIQNVRFACMVLRQSHWSYLVFDSIYGDENNQWLFNAIDENKENLLKLFPVKSIYVANGCYPEKASTEWLSTPIFLIFGSVMINIQVDHGICCLPFFGFEIDLTKDPTFRDIVAIIMQDMHVASFLTTIQQETNVYDLKIAEFYTNYDETFELDQKLLSVSHRSGKFELFLIGHVISDAVLDAFYGPLM